MQRRHFLALSTLAATSGSFQNAFASAHESLVGWRRYEVVTKVNVAEKTAQASVWIPVPIATLDNYQHTLDAAIRRGREPHRHAGPRGRSGR